MNWLQIGKLLGAKVIAVARGRDKTVMLDHLGADLVIDSGVVSKPLKQRIKSVAPQGPRSPPPPPLLGKAFVENSTPALVCAGRLFLIAA